MAGHHPNGGGGRGRATVVPAQRVAARMETDSDATAGHSLRDTGVPEDSAVLLAAALGSKAALARLRRVLAAERARRPLPPHTDPDDAEQDVWLRMLEHLSDGGSPASPSYWLRNAAREAEAAARSQYRWETPAGHIPAPRLTRSAEAVVVEAEERNILRAAVRRLPGRCPRLMAAFLEHPRLTYREIAEVSGISQGSIGPLRSRCLECLRRLLIAQGCTGPSAG